MASGRLSVAFLIGLSVLAQDARAWTPVTRVQLTDASIPFMPASLELALKRHREDVRRGMLEPLTREDSPAHLPPELGGTLDQSLADAAAAVGEAVQHPETIRFAELARRFGVLAHYVSDAGFPPVVSGPDGAARYGHFGKFCETRRDKFPLVFYGHADSDLARGDFTAFARRILARSRREDANLARAYAAAGAPPDPAAFDDRSIPFAIGSLSYSRTVNDIVRAWLAAWERAGGDLGKTPYVTAPPSGDAPSILSPPPDSGGSPR